jgi:hypothetical protein
MWVSWLYHYQMEKAVEKIWNSRLKPDFRFVVVFVLFWRKLGKFSTRNYSSLVARLWATLRQINGVTYLQWSDMRIVWNFLSTNIYVLNVTVLKVNQNSCSKYL